MNDKLKNPSCADVYSVHTMNPDVWMLCGVPETANCIQQGQLSDAASNSFPNISSLSLINICIINKEQISSLHIKLKIKQKIKTECF